MIISIHQPGYLPWLGFFKKILSSDFFVFLDDVQYEKNGWHNRNKIRTSEGSIWLTVPVKSNLSLNLNEIKVDNSSNWINKHAKSIEINYSKAENFSEFWRILEPVYEKKHERLVDLNMETINILSNMLEIKTKTIFSSELDISKTGSDRILDICKTLNADVYLAGALSQNYLKLEDFTKNHILVQFQNFKHPIYEQCYRPFVPNMSIIDLVFNEGKNSSLILKKAQNF